VPPPPSPAPVTPIRVLIADDDEMIRQTLIDAIEHTQVLSVIATATNADEAIRIASLRHLTWSSCAHAERRAARSCETALPMPHRRCPRDDPRA
jgi:hypothetical protein